MKPGKFIFSLPLLSLLFIGATSTSDQGCESSTPTTSSSGVSKVATEVITGSDGLTVEQRNVRDRLVTDNKPGAIKHLYVISAYSGQVLIYSTVRGKVTSSGKRLAPTSIVVGGAGDFQRQGFSTGIGSTVTSEVLQDDGTYGSSVEYVYWWDAKGVYHQHYIQGGQIVHISDAPLAVKSIVLNLEATMEEK